MSRLVASPEISVGLVSQFVSSPSLPETAAVDVGELKQVDGVRAQVLQKPWTCGNILSANSEEQEVTGCQTRNGGAIIKGENGDPHNNHRDWCGMPEKLLFDILLRLPVVSLIRLKSVCKSLCALVGSSTFITQHFGCNRGKDSLIAVDYSGDYCDRSCKLCLLSGSKYEVCSDLEYELEWNGYGEVAIGNCCNGIVCVVNKNKGIVELWNPALKQKKRLPESWISPSSLVLPREYYWTCGFGYDAESNDYKVVKIHMHVGKGSTHKCIVEVYSLRGDSWKIIQDGLPVPDLVDRRMPWQTLSVNGKCYWIGRADKHNEVVVSLDLNDERFETMALPGPSGGNLECQPYHVLDLLDGKLVCIKGTGNLWSDHAMWPTNYQIWVLQDDEDGAATKCWSKLYDLGPTTYICGEDRVPLAFSKDGRYLLLSSNPGGVQGIFVYGFAAIEDGGIGMDVAAIEDGGTGMEEPDLFLLSFDHYRESLVSLKGA